jgi:hypothetical protein
LAAYSFSTKKIRYYLLLDNAEEAFVLWDPLKQNFGVLMIKSEFGGFISYGTIDLNNLSVIAPGVMLPYNGP